MKKLTLLPILLFLTACTTDQITTTLNLAVDAAISVTSVTDPKDVVYAQAALACTSASSTILQSSETAIEKSADITKACSAAVLASVGTTPKVAAIVSALTNFLQQVSVLSSQITFADNQMVNSFMGSSKAKVSKHTLSQIDKKLCKAKKINCHK